MTGGWIKLHRQIVDGDLWNGTEPFDRRSAWIDLLLMVNHEPAEIMSGNKVFRIDRGQTWTTIKELSTRWRWSTKKTRLFIETLQRLRMVSANGQTKGTLLTVENYDIYQGQGQTDNTSKGKQRANNKNKKDKTDKKYIYTRARAREKPPEREYDMTVLERLLRNTN